MRITLSVGKTSYNSTQFNRKEIQYLSIDWSTGTDEIFIQVFLLLADPLCVYIFLFWNLSGLQTSACLSFRQSCHLLVSCCWLDCCSLERILIKPLCNLQCTRAYVCVCADQATNWCQSQKPSGGDVCLNPYINKLATCRVFNKMEADKNTFLSSQFIGTLSSQLSGPPPHPHHAPTLSHSRLLPEDTHCCVTFSKGVGLNFLMLQVQMFFFFFISLYLHYLLLPCPSPPSYHVGHLPPPFPLLFLFFLLIFIFLLAYLENTSVSTLFRLAQEAAN